MLNHIKLKNRPDRVGLDIGSHSIKGVEIIEKGSEMAIRSAGFVSSARLKKSVMQQDSNAIAHSIKSLWAKAGFETKKVIMALPSDAVTTKWLYLEANDEEELGQTARAVALRSISFNPNDAIADFRVLKSRGSLGRNIYFVLAVAASGSAIEKLLYSAELAGLEPEAVDIASVALIRSFANNSKGTSKLWGGQPHAHCVIGSQSTMITVIRENELEFVRDVPVGGDDFTNAIMEHTGLLWQEAEELKHSPATRLTENGSLITSYNGKEITIPCESVTGRMVREIQRSLKYFRSQFAEGSYLGMIGSTSLSGGGALIRGIESALRYQGLEINGIINPFLGFSVTAGSSGIEQVASCSAAFTTAVGLAMGDYWNNTVLSVNRTEATA
ncbi:MAG: type IV pilus assembly protein PilM [Armatimonadota bacterium]